MSEPAWTDARSEIDRIDREIVRLLAARRAVVGDVARGKRAAGAPPFDAAREASLREIWTHEAESVALPAAAAVTVLEAILTASREHVRGIYERDATDETG